MATEADILRALGRVEEAIAGIRESISHLREDFGDEKDHAHESRAVIHRRLDEQTSKIGKLETTVAISGQVDAQLRDQIADLRDQVESNQDAVLPALEEWKRMKALGYGISGLIALAGLTIGGIVAWASDGAVAALRHWLRIN
ncbi:putative nucleic acid-binding Zn-ribbon protein [Rhizobium tibeticum]|uniref:DUF1515 domain-containing protein n=1 Tax=Rhizobium tibeticum TaxID=501024 RepID=UPI002780E824|nr:DUF1515 domain-containing protein [Rhizobium tibeticum]MDP9809340.1 putative nucleic acid-binding Zn-ribbon protein [Rhizobium tibeticum]